MNPLGSARKKQIALAVVLADFVAFTAYAVAQHGYAGLFMYQLANAAGLQVLFDLCIALTIVMAWMWQDARRHDINPLPYVLMTLGLGSIGPLAYLVHRFGREAVAAPGMVAAPSPIGAGRASVARA